LSSEASAWTSFSQRNYFPALDGLRALAVSAVLFHHSTSRQLSGWAGRGHLGVQLFFCISGFLITTVLLREREAQGSISLVRFWWRRGLRILPLYYAVLALFALQAALDQKSAETAAFFGNLPFFASFTSNWFVAYAVPHAVRFGFAWSLSTEQQFYFVWPLLLASFGNRLALVALPTLIAVDQLAELHWLPGVARHGLATNVVTSFSSSIALGALLAVLLATPKVRVFATRWLAHPFAVSGLGLLALAQVLHPPKIFLAFEASLALWVAAAAVREPRRHHLLSAPLLAAVGTVSYGMYLFHVPVIGALKLLAPGIVERPLWLAACALVITFGLASLSRRWFETPLLALRPASRARPAQRFEAPAVSAGDVTERRSALQPATASASGAARQAASLKNQRPCSSRIERASTSVKR
jgi:peptidoglycan/LPS O-acetylase OafA/YrhL